MCSSPNEGCEARRGGNEKGRRTSILVIAEELPWKYDPVLHGHHHNVEDDPQDHQWNESGTLDDQQNSHEEQDQPENARMTTSLITIYTVVPR